MSAYASTCGRRWAGREKRRRREHIFVQGQRDRSDRTCSCRVVCRVMLCSAFMSVIWHVDDFPSSPCLHAPSFSPSLTLESHLGPDNSIITTLGWPGPAIFPLSTDQVTAWTWVTAARLVRTHRLLVASAKNKKKRERGTPSPAGAETRPDQIQATQYHGLSCQGGQNRTASPAQPVRVLARVCVC